MESGPSSLSLWLQMWQFRVPTGAGGSGSHRGRGQSRVWPVPAALPGVGPSWGALQAPAGLGGLARGGCLAEVGAVGWSLRPGEPLLGIPR